MSTTDPGPPPGIDSDESKEGNRVEELKQFFKLKDPALVTQAELLVKEHSLDDLAQALRSRYAMLPPKWRNLVRSQSTFSTSPSSTFTTGRATGNVGLAARSPAKSEFTMSMSAVAEGSATSSFQTGSMESVGDGSGSSSSSSSSSSNSSSSAVAASAKSELGASSATASSSLGVSHLDQVINELVTTEEQFLQRIKDLRSLYVDKIYEILGGKYGDEAVSALKLNLDQANQVFTPLGEVVRFSENLLTRLAVVSLVRTPPKSGKSRAEYVAEAFLAVADRVKAYAPVITTYQSSLAVIDEAAKGIKPKKNSKHWDFMKWWEEVSKGSDLLRGQGLQAVLITPMQRIPRYRMLLDEILKRCDEAAKPQVTKALDTIQNAAKEINEAVRKHEKISKFFGAGSELKPVRATQTSGKDGQEVRIRNEYVVNLPSKFQ